MAGRRQGRTTLQLWTHDDGEPLLVAPRQFPKVWFGWVECVMGWIACPNLLYLIPICISVSLSNI